MRLLLHGGAIMKAEISPEKYRQFCKDFNKVKGYSVARFIQWVNAVYQSGYDDGWNDAMDSYKETDGGIAVDESVDAYVLDADTLYDVLMSVKGIGEKRARIAIDRICNMSGKEQE